MIHLEQLETRQVGLRLAKHLVDDVDELIKDYNINRSMFITTAIEKFVKEQKERRFYDRFETSITELKSALDGKSKVRDAWELLDELED